MISINSCIKIVDNSGGLIFYCIKIYGKRKIKTKGNIGDVIIGSIKRSSRKKKKVKVGDLMKAVIVRIKRPIYLIDGSILNFSESGVILLSNKMQPVANRIFGPIPKKLVKKGFIKILSLTYATV